MKKFLSFAAFALLSTSALHAEVLRIAAAANISYPLKEITAAFNKKFPTIQLDVNTGASGGFNSQIKQGADYDVFLSADMGFAQDLEGLAKTSAEPYTQGVLMLFSAQHKTVAIEDLKNAKCIAIANEKTAPYGRAALQVLKGANIDASAVLVRSPSIAATLSTALKACEYGFVAASAAKTLKEQGYSDAQMLRLEGYDPILQGMITLKKSDAADKFVAFLKSPEAKQIFANYGYK